MFRIEKGERHGDVEVHRLIMNLIPSNSICLSVEGDVGTLPMLQQMNALQLHPHEEMVLSSEDVRCFFYVFALLTVWLPYPTFNFRSSAPWSRGTLFLGGEGAAHEIPQQCGDSPAHPPELLA